MRKTRLAITVALILATATSAWATAAHLGVFNSTYKPKSGTALATSGCNTCHIGSNFKKLNPYGTALKGKAVNAGALKSIEKQDSDKDTFTNIDEIKAGTLPGDAKSKPAKSTSASYVDPVCKMKVTTSAKGGKTAYKGKTYYFCSAKCKTSFTKTPAKYVKK